MTYVNASSSTSSSSSSSTTYSSNKLTGLATGLDTESIVKELMAAKTVQLLDPAQKQKQMLEWQQEDYRTVNTKLLALQTSLSDLRLQGTFNAETVASSDSTVATATATTATAGDYSIVVSSLASGVTKESTPTTTNYANTSSSKSFTLTGETGSATITVAVGDTISTVVSAINKTTSTTGIKASYDSSQNKFYLMSTDTGTSAKIAITDTDGYLADDLNVDTTSKTGTNASITFNGGSALSFSSNTFTYNGLSLNLHKTGTVDLTVSTDVDTIVTKIKSFVDAYNNTLSDISGRLSEQKNVSYSALSDDQIAEMTDAQVTAWNTKARAGDLNGESLLMDITSRVRTDATGQVSGVTTSKYNCLSSIGISTENYYDNGKLVIDETTLRAALTDNPDAVKELFTNTGTTTSSTGIAQRLYTEVTADIKMVKNRAGSDSDSVDNSVLGKEITDTTDRISDIKTRLTQIETRYNTEYTNLETAMSKLNSQSSWISNLLSSSSSSS